MNYAIHRISLDVADDSPSQITIHAKQGDNAKVLIISLLDHKKNYQIAQGSVANFIAKKANGIWLEHPCEIDYANNKVLYKFQDKTVSSAGAIDCEIHLSSPKSVTKEYMNDKGEIETAKEVENENLTTASFVIAVHENILVGVTDETSEAPLIPILVKEAEGLLGLLEETTIPNVETATKNAITATSNAEEATANAETATENAIAATAKANEAFENSQNYNYIRYVTMAEYEELEEKESNVLYVFTDDNTLEKIYTAIEEQNAKIDTAIEEQNATIDTTIVEQNATIDTAIEELNAKIDTAIEEQNATIDTTIVEQNATIDTAIEELNAKIDTAIEEQNERITEAENVATNKSHAETSNTANKADKASYVEIFEPDFTQAGYRIYAQRKEKGKAFTNLYCGYKGSENPENNNYVGVYHADNADTAKGLSLTRINASKIPQNGDRLAVYIEETGIYLVCIQDANDNEDRYDDGGRIAGNSYKLEIIVVDNLDESAYFDAHIGDMLDRAVIEYNHSSKMIYINNIDEKKVIIRYAIKIG